MSVYHRHYRKHTPVDLGISLLSDLGREHLNVTAFRDEYIGAVKFKSSLHAGAVAAHGTLRCSC